MTSPRRCRHWMTRRRKGGFDTLVVPPRWQRQAEQEGQPAEDQSALLRRFAFDMTRRAWSQGALPLPVLAAERADGDVWRCACRLSKVCREVALALGEDTEPMRRRLFDETGAAALSGRWEGREHILIAFDGASLQPGQGTRLLVNLTGRPASFSGLQAVGAEVQGLEIEQAGSASGTLASALLRRKPELAEGMRLGNVWLWEGYS